MKKYIWAISAIFAIGSVAIVSCEKESNSLKDNVAVSHNQRFCDVRKNLKLNKSDRESIAREITMRFGQNNAIFAELNNAIHVVTEYGLDENLKLYDILQPEKSVFLASATSVANLRSAIGENNPLAGYGFSESDYYGDLQFYWPYHDDWDKTTTPIICFAPENENAESTTGFYYNNGTVITVNVTAKSIDEGNVPVVIINQCETHYSDYPNFNRDEWTINGRIWVKPGNVSPFRVINDGSSTDDKVYEARSYSITSSGTQYDYAWAGGSEFVLQSVYAADENNLQTSSMARAEFTRKEIRNKKTKNFGAQLHENWQPGLGNIYLRLTEEDAWGSIDPLVINIDVNGNTLSTTININSTDDVIFDAQCTRSNYFNRCNNEGGVFDLGSERVNCLLDIYDSYGD